MDRKLSWLASAGSADDVERALTEVDAAITMVIVGAARSVRLCNLAGAEDAAFDAAARAQAADVSFSLLREPARSVAMVIGPRLHGAAARSTPLGPGGDHDQGTPA